MFGQCLAHLTLVSEVESIADQNFWDAGSMLIDLIFRKDPKGFPIKKFVRSGGRLEVYEEKFTRKKLIP